MTLWHLMQDVTAFVQLMRPILDEQRVIITMTAKHDLCFAQPRSSRIMMCLYNLIIMAFSDDAFGIDDKSFFAQKAAKLFHIGMAGNDQRTAASPLRPAFQQDRADRLKAHARNDHSVDISSQRGDAILKHWDDLILQPSLTDGLPGS